MYLQEVLLYLDPDDGSSQAARAFLAGHGVAVVERDVRKDPALWDELAAMGSTRLPTIVVNGVAVAGFDPQLLREVLGL